MCSSLICKRALVFSAWDAGLSPEILPVRHDVQKLSCGYLRIKYSPTPIKSRKLTATTGTMYLHGRSHQLICGNLVPKEICVCS